MRYPLPRSHVIRNKAQSRASKSVYARRRKLVAPPALSPLVLHDRLARKAAPKDSWPDHCVSSLLLALFFVLGLRRRRAVSQLLVKYLRTDAEASANSATITSEAARLFFFFFSFFHCEVIRSCLPSVIGSVSVALDEVSSVTGGIISNAGREC